MARSFLFFFPWIFNERSRAAEARATICRVLEHATVEKAYHPPRHSSILLQSNSIEWPRESWSVSLYSGKGWQLFGGIFVARLDEEIASRAFRNFARVVAVFSRHTTTQQSTANARLSVTFYFYSIARWWNFGSNSEWIRSYRDFMADFHEIPFSAAQCIFFHCDETRDLFPPYVFGEIHEDFLFFFFFVFSNRRGKRYAEPRKATRGKRRKSS